MALRGFMRAPGEYTRVGTETEVTIPWQTYRKLVRSGTTIVVDLWGIIYMGWLRFRLGESWQVPWWLKWPWIPVWLLYNWPWLIVMVLLGQAVASGIYAYSLIVELMTKQGPQYEAMDPKDGRWRPFRGHHREEPEEQEEWEEPEPGRWVEVRYREANKMMYELFPDSREAKAFYRAVLRNESFSWATARRFRVPRGVFERDIRDAFFERQWAEWKDFAHHDQGIQLKGQGRAVLRALVEDRA